MLSHSGGFSEGPIALRNRVRAIVVRGDFSYSPRVMAASSFLSVLWLSSSVEAPKHAWGASLALMEKKLENNTAQSFSLQYLSSGLYFYQLKIGEQVLASGKVVKE